MQTPKTRRASIVLLAAAAAQAVAARSQAHFGSISGKKPRHRGAHSDTLEAPTPAYASQLAPSHRFAKLRTLGYQAAGDGGGAIYKNVKTEPAHSGKIKTADGRWWEISEKFLRPEFFGGYPRPSNGTADATEGISNCFKASLHTGRPVQIPEGEYLISREITINASGKRLSISGAGPGKTILSLSGFCGPLTIYGDGPDSRCSAEISNLTIRRPDVASYAGPIGKKTLYVNYGRQVIIHSVEEYGAIGFGIHLRYCSNSIVRRCYVHDHKNGSKHLSGTDGIHFSYCVNGQAHSNRIERVGDDSISFGAFIDERNPESERAMTCRNNIIHDVSTGIKVFGSSSDITITDNIVVGAHDGGIIVWADRGPKQSFDIRHIKITSNFISRCGNGGKKGGVYVVAPGGNGTMTFDDISVRNNIITNCYIGISMSSVTSSKIVSNAEIVGNYITGSTLYGIFIDHIARRIAILRNQVAGFGERWARVSEPVGRVDAYFGNNIIENGSRTVHSIDYPEFVAGKLGHFLLHNL
jgi:hypothetical protein